MENLMVKIKVLQSEKGNQGQIPAYATPGSAAVDLRACLDDPVVIPPGGRAKIKTGLSIEIPTPQIVALIFARSGLADKYGICLTNGVGVIDSDYRGEIQVLLSNHGSEAFTVKNGDRIAQMAFVPVYLVRFVQVDELGQTARGTGGFGSTGI